MATNPYKNFIVYKHNISNLKAFVEAVSCDPNDETDESVLQPYAHRDPTGGQWKNGGLAVISRRQFVMELNTSAFMMHVQFNERILPSKVRDELVAKRCKAFYEAEGRVVGKKQYREIRDDVEIELLPQAFIRRTVIPVIFMEHSNLMLVFTSSVTKGDSVIHTLIPAMNEIVDEVSFSMCLPKGNIIQNLTNLVNNDEIEGQDDFPFQLGSYAVLKGTESEDKKVVRIKDLDMHSSDVTQLMKRDYFVYDLMLEYAEDGNFAEPLLEFKVNDKFVFRGCTFNGIQIESVKRDDKESELLSMAWLVARTYREIVDALINYMGGPIEALQVPDEDEEI